jgi:tryptophan-rich sensory protein
MNGMREAAQYAQWIQPSWAPPSWLFGPVWSVLYALIAISFGYVFYKAFKGEIPKLVAVPFAINLLANASFTPVQFGLQNLSLAALVIVLVWVTIPWMMWVVYPHAKWVAYMQIPYLLWVSIATVLQLTITYLNW